MSLNLESPTPISLLRVSTHTERGCLTPLVATCWRKRLGATFPLARRSNTARLPNTGGSMARSPWLAMVFFVFVVSALSRRTLFSLVAAPQASPYLGVLRLDLCGLH